MNIHTLKTHKKVIYKKLRGGLRDSIENPPKPRTSGLADVDISSDSDI